MKTMKHAVIVVAIAVLALGMALPVSADDGKPLRPDAGKITISGSFFDASGDAGFVASGADPELGVGPFGRWRSKLEFDLDAQYADFTARYVLPSSRVPLGITVRYAAGNADGKCIDSDWENPLDPALWFRTQSDCNADTDIWSADISWWLSLGGAHPEVGIELFAGYFEQRAHFDVRNILVLDDPYDTASWDTYTGDVATWELNVEAARLGARTTVPLGKGFAVNAELAVLIGRATGEGNWKLREYFFQQKADGTGVDALLGLQYAPTKNIAIQAGGRYYKFEGEDGTESGQQPDFDFVNKGYIDEITVSQLGWFAGVQIRF
jgi:opacity protein-like surface antigen